LFDGDILYLVNSKGGKDEDHPIDFTEFNTWARPSIDYADIIENRIAKKLENKLTSLEKQELSKMIETSERHRPFRVELTLYGY
jgi:hypothetical protein